MHSEEHCFLFYRFLLVLDHHAYCNIHCGSSMKQKSTCRHIGNIFIATNQPQYLLLFINTACLSTEKHRPFDCLDFPNEG